MRTKTISELIAEGIVRAEETGMTMPKNLAKVIQLHLFECGYKVIPLDLLNQINANEAGS